MDGILLVDKPIGPSSFDVIRKIKKVTGIKKIGHAGTLDPLASGLMVICLGRYTKLAGVLTDSSKVYQAEVTLGVKTTTDDTEGEVIEENAVNVERDALLKVVDTFKGEIEQRPPNFSAVKINGQRAYKLARADLPVEIKARAVNIIELSIEKIEMPRFTIQVHCSKGTYIRSLARDIGQKLRCGAHASMIRRISSGGFFVKDAVKLEEVVKESLNILSGAKDLRRIEQVEVSAFDRDHIVHGRPISLAKINNNVALAVCEGELIAILRLENEKTLVARVI